MCFVLAFKGSFNATFKFFFSYNIKMGLLTKDSSVEDILKVLSIDSPLVIATEPYVLIGGLRKSLEDTDYKGVFLLIKNYDSPGAKLVGAASISKFRDVSDAFEICPSCLVSSVSPDTTLEAAYRLATHEKPEYKYIVVGREIVPRVVPSANIVALYELLTDTAHY